VVTGSAIVPGTSASLTPLLVVVHAWSSTELAGLDESSSEQAATTSTMMVTAPTSAEESLRRRIPIHLISVGRTFKGGFRSPRG
jgi:hypothetical protein